MFLNFLIDLYATVNFFLSIVLQKMNCRQVF